MISANHHSNASGLVEAEASAEVVRVARVRWDLSGCFWTGACSRYCVVASTQSLKFVSLLFKVAVDAAVNVALKLSWTAVATAAREMWMAHRY